MAYIDRFIGQTFSLAPTSARSSSLVELTTGALVPSLRMVNPGLMDANSSSIASAMGPMESRTVRSDGANVLLTSSL